VLSCYDIDWSEHHLDCSAVSLLLISRRDYITHARNPHAVVRRKISNERQLVATLRSLNPSHSVQSVQLETLSMRQQLRTVASSDVIVAMNGAGLTHAMFLPERAAVVEIASGRTKAGNRHFQAIARWRGIEYERWTSQRPEADTAQSNYTTYVPPDAIDKLVKRVIHRLCHRD